MVKSLFFGLLVTLTAAGASADGDVCSQWGPLAKYQPAQSYCSASYAGSPCTSTVTAATATVTTTVATVYASVDTTSEASTTTDTVTTTSTMSGPGTVTTTTTETTTITSISTVSTTDGPTTTTTTTGLPIEKRHVGHLHAKRGLKCRPLGSTTSSAGWSAITTADSPAYLYSSLTGAGPAVASSICSCIEASQTTWAPQTACATTTVGAGATVTSSVTYTTGATETVTITGSVVTVTTTITVTASATPSSTVTVTTTTTSTLQATVTTHLEYVNGDPFDVTYGEVLTNYGGTAVPVPGVTSVNACLNACDLDSQCGAFTFDGTTCTIIDNYNNVSTAVLASAGSAYGVYAGTADTSEA